MNRSKTNKISELLKTNPKILNSSPKKEKPLPNPSEESEETLIRSLDQLMAMDLPLPLNNSNENPF